MLILEQPGLASTGVLATLWTAYTDKLAVERVLRLVTPAYPLREEGGHRASTWEGTLQVRPQYTDSDRGKTIKCIHEADAGQLGETDYSVQAFRRPLTSLRQLVGQDNAPSRSSLPRVPAALLHPTRAGPRGKRAPLRPYASRMLTALL